MDEVSIRIKGVDAIFANAAELHRARTSRPDLFMINRGRLMLRHEGLAYRVILPLTESDILD